MEILGDFGINGPVLIASIVNFAILAVVLWFVMIKPLLGLLETRETTIRQSLDRARLNAQEASLFEVELATKRAQATETAKQLISDATKQAHSIVSKAEEDAQRKADAIVVTGQARLVSERDELMEDATHQLADVVADATKLVIGKTMSKEIDTAMIADTLKTMEQQ